MGRWGRMARVAMFVAAAWSAVTACGSEPTGPSPSPTTVPERIAVRLDGVDAGTGMVRWHDCVLLFGEDAERAAREAGDPMGAPNGVWIRELPTTGSAPIAEDAHIVLLGHDAEGSFVQKPATLQTFLLVFSVGPRGTEWTDAPWLLLDVVDGTVVGVEQPELP